LRRLAGKSNWLDRARREIPKSARRRTANSAEGNLTAVMAVPNLAIFRGVASTLLNEMGFHPDWIERQLAHDERNKVRAAYNHAQYHPERRRMMQQWADYLDNLAEGGKVIVHRFRRTA
jgi:hypothetical protein